MIIGILGGGQLARMMALAGYPLGLRFRVLDPAPDACTGHLAEHIQAEFDDPEALRELARGCDVVTYEFENVPAGALEQLEGTVPLYPPPAALRYSQDRLREKELFAKLDIPTPRHRPVDCRQDLDAAVAEIGLPGVIKTRRLGYDGKGQRVLRAESDLDPAWEQLGKQALIYEALIPFERELSIISVRGRNGKSAYYPVPENTHTDGILRESLVRPNDPMQQRAEAYAGRLLDALDYVGVLTLELFQLDGQLLANEFAPRVHNSGHWSIEGAETSQFENHLRALMGLPLGKTRLLGHIAMVNFIGQLPDTTEVLACAGTHFHGYGKPERPGRKVGHGTIRASSVEKLQTELVRLKKLALP